MRTVSQMISTLDKIAGHAEESPAVSRKLADEWIAELRQEARDGLSADCVSSAAVKLGEPGWIALDETPLEMRCVDGLEIEAVDLNGTNTRVLVRAARVETLYVREAVELTTYEGNAVS